MARKFTRKRWRRPQRLTLEGPFVVRRKDVVVPDVLVLDPTEAWRSNRRRMAALLVGFLALSGLEGFIVTLAGAPWFVVPGAAALAFAYLIAGARFGDGWMRRALRARPRDLPEVTNMLEGVAVRAGVPPPELYVSSGEAPNGIALGLRRRWVLVSSATTGLGRLELEGILAHEVAHLRDGDSALASAYVLIGGSMELAVKAAAAPGGPLAWLALPLWPVCVVVRASRPFLFPADREHRADVVGALLTRYPPGMRSALSGSTGEHGTASLKITDPFWFAPRTDTRGPDAARRAELVGEM